MEKVETIKFRLFGSKDCKTCEKQKKSLRFNGFDFSFIDIDEDKNDQICDKYNVEDVPHLQAYLQETGEILLEYVGYVTPPMFLAMLADKCNEKDSPHAIKGIFPNFGTIKTTSRDCGCGSKSKPKPSAGASGES